MSRSLQKWQVFWHCYQMICAHISFTLQIKELNRGARKLLSCLSSYVVQYSGVHPRRKGTIPIHLELELEG